MVNGAHYDPTASIIHSNARSKVHIKNAEDDTIIQSKETIEKQRRKIVAEAHSTTITEDTVEISEQARTLSKAAQAIAQSEVAIQADADASLVISGAPLTEKVNATASAPSLASKEGRAEQAKDYNAILADLRDKFGEKEAMRRFDAIMKTDGYELVEDAKGSGGPASLGNGTGTIDQMQSLLTSMSINSGAVSEYLASQGLGTSNWDSNLHLQTQLRGTMIDGNMELLAETFAAYGVEVSLEALAAVNSWFDKNLDSLQSGADFDVAGLMKKLNPTGQLSAASISSELGTITSDLLKKAGIELKEGENISFTLDADDKGNFTGLTVHSNVDLGEAGKKLQKLIDADPSVMQAFVKEYGSVEKADLSQLEGQYADGGRSVEYSQGRSFVYSGDAPSSVVMTDYLGVHRTGYMYQKKVSDTFDPTNADSVVVVTDAAFIQDQKSGKTSTQELQDAMIQKIKDALASGGAVDSTMSREEYEAKKPEWSFGNRQYAENSLHGKHRTEEEMRQEDMAAQAQADAKAEAIIARNTKEQEKKSYGISDSPTMDMTKSTEQKRLESREAKEAEGARYDAVLAELREKYNEKEAIARFNEFIPLPL